MLDICFRCSDAVTRNRPSLTPQQVLAEYRGKDPQTVAWVDEALETYDEIEEASGFDRFNPTGNVDKRKEHGIQIYQDFGVLDEKEFVKLTGGLTPKQCGKKPVPFHLGLAACKKQQLFLIHLRGLDVGEILSMRKCRLFFTDSVEFSKNYVNAQNQILENQPAYVLDFCYDLTFKQTKDEEKSTEKKPQLFTAPPDDLEQVMRAGCHAKTPGSSNIFFHYAIYAMRCCEYVRVGIIFTCPTDSSCNMVPIRFIYIYGFIFFKKDISS